MIFLSFSGELDDFLIKRTERKMGEDLVKQQFEKDSNIIAISIRESLKKGFHFNYQNIIEEASANCFLNTGEAIKHIERALEILQLERTDFLDRK